MKQKRPHGQVRLSQLITTYGPGAMVDLPRYAVVIAGLEHWSGEMREVHEQRLVAKLEAWLQVQRLRLREPPIDRDDPQAPSSGIRAYQFPEWFVSQYYEARGRFRVRALVHRRHLVGNRYQDRAGKRHPVVPVRFVQGCINGHLSDIDWHGFVHEHNGEPCHRDLWIQERGSSGDLADVWILCDCGASRSMAQATRRDMNALGLCSGQRPWLGPGAREKCGGEEGKVQFNRLLLRSASDAYFAQVVRVISLPEAQARLKAAVDSVWADFLLYVESLEDLRRERKKARVANALEGLDEAEIWVEIQRRGKGTVAPGKSIKSAEIESLRRSELEIGEDVPEGPDFFARRMDFARVEAMGHLDRVVLVHRLREVMALIGFTRFEAAVPDIEGELSLDVRRAPLAQDLQWVPAVENRGEGFFLSLQVEAVQTWLDRSEVKKRGRQLLDGFIKWKAPHPQAAALEFSLPYVLLHSLSHLLITAVSIECGYAASSIRERIYAGEGGYGVLLYTGTPDAEGTLGGLVEVGRQIDKHLSQALDIGRLCSNDPVCAQHRPDSVHEERFLHGAACHGCLLIAEPSCERRNEFLDRALVVPTVEGLGAEFFS